MNHIRQHAFFIITLAILFTRIGFGLAADAKLPFIVRTIYFKPVGAPAAPKIIPKLMKETQAFFASEMVRHGFEPKTFRLETDAQGEVIVHTLNGRGETWEYLNSTSEKIAEETPAEFQNPNMVHVFFLGGLKNVHNNACGLGSSITGGVCGGNAFIPATGHCFSLKTIAHELGHTFGLWHELANTQAIMTQAAIGDEFQYFECRWLDKQHYFNDVHAINSVPKILRIHSLKHVEDHPHAFVEFNVEVESINPLHQFHILGAGNNGVLGWTEIQGKRDTARVLARRAWLKNYDQVAFQVLDAQGNHLMEYTHFRLPSLNPIPAENKNTDIVDEKTTQPIGKETIKPEKPEPIEKEKVKKENPNPEKQTPHDINAHRKFILLWAEVKR